MWGFSEVNFFKRGCDRGIDLFYQDLYVHVDFSLKTPIVFYQ